MNWNDIAEMAHAGFDIGNHTMNHPDLRKLSDENCRRELELLNEKFAEYGIPVPVSFAYPGGPFAANAVEIISTVTVSSAFAVMVIPRTMVRVNNNASSFFIVISSIFIC